MDTLTSIVELGVGIGCVAGGVVSWRGPRLRLLAAILVVAGTVACIHAIVALGAS